ASHHDEAAVRNQQAAMIHGGRGSLFADRFPFAGGDVKSEGHRGRLGGLAVVANSVVVVGRIGAAGKIDPAASLFRWPRAGRDAIARVAGMRGKFRPFDSCDVTLLRTGKLANPALVRREVFGTHAAHIPVSAV